MLQMIDADKVLDGEPRLWCSHSNGGIGKTQGALHTESRRESGCQSCEFAIVDRPAPPTAAQPPPVLDLDALAEAERAMTAGPWPIIDLNDREPGPPVWCGSNFGGVAAIGPIHYDADEDETVPGSPAYLRAEADSRGLVALRNAAPHLIAEARAAVALRAEVADLAAIRADERARYLRDGARHLAERDHALAELAAARAVPPDVEAAIKSTVDGAEEAGRCSALGHAYLITKAPFWTVPRLKAAIARDKAAAVEAAVTQTVEEARVLADEIRAKFTPSSKPATVGGLLATVPVAMVECPYCKRPDGAVNHVPGHVFVGMGHGWQPCVSCDGSASVPADPATRGPIEVP